MLALGMSVMCFPLLVMGHLEIKLSDECCRHLVSLR